MMFFEKRFDTEEVMLNYAEGPKNGPPLVILHGTTARWQNHIPLINHFINRWHIYALDFRGHGESGRTPNKYGLRYMYNDTIRFITQVVKEPAHIFGHSLGGRVAIIIAANNSYITKSIIIRDSSLKYDMKSTGFDKRMRKLDEVLAKKRTLKEIKEEYIERWRNHPVHLWTKARDYLQLDPKFPLSVADNCDDPDDPESYVYGYKPLELMRKISCPVLLIQAETSQMKDVEKALEILSDAYHVKIDGFSHALHYGNVTPIAKAINYFLESIR